MIYSLSLSTASLLTGLVLLILAAAAWFQPGATEQGLRAFPRSRGWGLGLLAVATAWFWLLIKSMDLGEFSNWRNILLLIIPVAGVLTAIYVDEMLSVRALGMVVLLAAEPLLEAAFLKPPTSRLLLVVLTYAAILAAMFWIGMPYVLRDHVGWLTATRQRLRGAAMACGAYGAVLVILALTLHRSA